MTPNSESVAGVPLELLAKEHAAWSQATFGSDSERGPLGPLKHLEKEAREAQESPTDPSEYADCLLLILDAARRAGFDAQSLVNYAWSKLQVNKKRNWPKGVSPNDAVLHIKKAERPRPNSESVEKLADELISTAQWARPGNLMNVRAMLKSKVIGFLEAHSIDPATMQPMDSLRNEATPCATVPAQATELPAQATELPAQATELPAQDTPPDAHRGAVEFASVRQQDIDKVIEMKDELAQLKAEAEKIAGSSEHPAPDQPAKDSGEKVSADVLAVYELKNKAHRGVAECRCTTCGYTLEDVKTLGDHSRCSGYPFFEWEEKQMKQPAPAKDVEREIAEAIRGHLQRQHDNLGDGYKIRDCGIFEDIIAQHIKPLRDELERVKGENAALRKRIDQWETGTSKARRTNLVHKDVYDSVQQQLAEAREALAEIKDEHQHLAELQQQLAESRKRVKELDAVRPPIAGRFSVECPDGYRIIGTDSETLMITSSHIMALLICDIEQIDAAPQPANAEADDPTPHAKERR